MERAIKLGVIPPLSLFFMRLKMKNSSSFQKLHMKTLNTEIILGG